MASHGYGPPPTDPSCHHHLSPIAGDGHRSMAAGPHAELHMAPMHPGAPVVLRDLGQPGEPEVGIRFHQFHLLMLNVGNEGMIQN